VCVSVMGVCASISAVHDKSYHCQSTPRMDDFQGSTCICNN